MEKIKAEVTDGQIVIKMPIDLLAFAFENKEGNEEYKVTNHNIFAQSICDYLNGSLNDNENAQALGITDFEYFIDGIMDKVFEIVSDGGADG